MKYLMFLLLLGCGGKLLIPDCTEFIAGGLTVCSEKAISPRDVAETVAIVEQEAFVRYNNVIAFDAQLQSHGTVVYFLDVEYMAENCHSSGYDDLYYCDKIISGQNRNGVEIIAKWYPCLADSSLAHELIHSVDFFYLDSSDEMMTNHTTPWLFSNWAWTNGYPGQSVEDRAYDRLQLTNESCR